MNVGFLISAICEKLLQCDALLLFGDGCGRLQLPFDSLKSALFLHRDSFFLFFLKVQSDEGGRDSAVLTRVQIFFLHCGASAETMMYSPLQLIGKCVQLEKGDLLFPKNQKSPEQRRLHILEGRRLNLIAHKCA